MERLDVTDSLVDGLVWEVAPLVEDATGWGLGLERLHTRVLAKDRGYEEVVLGRLRGAGIDFDEDEPRSLLERLLEYVVEGCVLGAYQPAGEELLIVRENVDESNLNGLRVVIAHELVHRGQHVNHGDLFERVDAAARRVFQLISRGAPVRDVRAEVERIKPLMTLLESHAHYVQQLIQSQYYADAVIESHFSLPVLLMRVFGRAKLSQYKDGVPMVAAAMAQGDVDGLYTALR
jgi:hypothetical protein